MPRIRYTPITPQEVEDLCLLVKPRAYLYVCQHVDYHDSQKSFNAWQDISEKMGNSSVDAEFWKKKWRNLRDTYVRRRREMKFSKSGQGATNTKKWQYYDLLNTILESVTTAETETNVPSQQQVEEAQDSDDGELSQHNSMELAEESDNDTSCSQQDPDLDRESTPGSANISGVFGQKRTSTPHGKASQQLATSCDIPEIKTRKRGKKSGDALGDALADYVKTRTSVVVDKTKHLQPEYQSAEDAFFDSCKIRMKDLSKDNKSILMLQISQLFFNAENPHLPQQSITPLPVMMAPPQPSPYFAQQPRPGYQFNQPTSNTFGSPIRSGFNRTEAPVSDILSQAMGVIDNDNQA